MNFKKVFSTIFICFFLIFSLNQEASAKFRFGGKVAKSVAKMGYSPSYRKTLVNKFVKTAKSLKGRKTPTFKKPTFLDKWSRKPKSIQDRLTLDAARKKGAGGVLTNKLGDPKFRGMQKMEYKTKSNNGRDSVVHYVRDPRTKSRMDFKFKKHSVEPPSKNSKKTKK